MPKRAGSACRLGERWGQATNTSPSPVHTQLRVSFFALTSGIIPTPATLYGVDLMLLWSSLEDRGPDSLKYYSFLPGPDESL